MYTHLPAFVLYVEPWIYRFLDKENSFTFAPGYYKQPWILLLDITQQFFCVMHFILSNVSIPSVNNHSYYSHLKKNPCPDLFHPLTFILFFYSLQQWNSEDLVMVTIALQFSLHSSLLFSPTKPPKLLSLRSLMSSMFLNSMVTFQSTSSSSLRRT